MNQFNIALDLDKSVSRTPPTVRLRQGDQDGTVIAATIYDHGAALGGTVTACAIVMKLPDGTHYYRKGATLAGGVATVTVDERQAASVVGRTMLAYFTVTVGTAQYSTGAFVVVVEPDAVGDAELPEDYDTAIQEAIDRCNAAAAALEGALPIGTANLANGAVTADKLADAVRKGYVRSFETVAAMQAATDLKAGMTCHTNGFHASGDGGAAYYTVSASGTANGMDVLALQGGLFATLVVTEPYVTPEQFGAWGDNIHDDAAAINRMLASGYSKNYVFSKIEYLCKANVTISTADNSLAGQGMFTSGIHFADGFGLVVDNPRNTFADMKFRGGAGVTCNYYHVSFFRCWFFQAKNGITLNNGHVTQIVNCHVTFNKVGILFKNQSFESLVTGCVVDNNIIGVMVVGSTSGPVIRDCTIEGNYNRESGAGCGVFISNSNTRVVIDGCHFEVNGSGQDGADILEYTNSPTTDISAITDEVSSLYSDTLYMGSGIVSVTNCKFTFTKYGIITGGYKLETNISGCYFSGRLGMNNKPILVNAPLLNNAIRIRDNQVFNTDNLAINDEMLSGVKKSYVFTDATPVTNQVAALLNGTIWLDGCPLFLYKGRVADLSGTVTYTKLWSNAGTSENGGIVNGNLTNYYTGATTIYVSNDGTSGGVAVVPEAGYHEFVLVTNSVGARFQRAEGWLSITPRRAGVYPINRYTLVTKNMFASNDSIVYALIDLSEADIAKMKQCIGFEPTDLDLHEFR